MNNTLTLVAYMAILTWLMLIVASLMRARAWTFSGLMLALGNREKMPDASPLAARADRAARNTLENFV
ncbi:MAG TPA: MAPEG family protein, partial [Burkholderiaceae bacterium]|nr:MAPEG family protein [Burkholderiaceae bacterium]